MGLSMYGQGVDASVANLVYVFPKIPEVGNWHHIAVVLHEEGMRLYFDGERVAENSNRFKLPKPCAFPIGANDNGPSRFFAGAIDEVCIFNRALEDEEIRALYESSH